MNKPGVMIYFNMRPSRRFSAAKRAMLYDAMLDYAETGAEPDFQGAMAIAWETIIPILARDQAKYAELCEKRSKAAMLGGIATREAAMRRREALAESQDTPNGLNIGLTEPEPPNLTEHNLTELRESIADAPAPRKKFTPPSEAEVTAYVLEANLAMDPQGFVDYYTANGWRVGSHTMKDWRAAARNWARKEKQLPQQPARANAIVLAPLEDPYDPVY